MASRRGPWPVSRVLGWAVVSELFVIAANAAFGNPLGKALCQLVGWACSTS